MIKKTTRKAVIWVIMLSVALPFVVFSYLSFFLFMTRTFFRGMSIIADEFAAGNRMSRCMDMAMCVELVNTPDQKESSCSCHH